MSVNQIVAPFLDSIKLKEIEEKAIRLQSSVVEFKRHAAAPPYQIEKQSLVDVLSVFPEGGNKKEHILGGKRTSTLKDIDASTGFTYVLRVKRRTSHGEETQNRCERMRITYVCDKSRYIMYVINVSRKSFVCCEK